MLLYESIAAHYTATLGSSFKYGNRPSAARRALQNGLALQFAQVKRSHASKRQTRACRRMTSHEDDVASSSSSPVPSADPPVQLPEASPEKPAVKGKPKKEYRQIQMPSAEQIVQEDMMNNCGIRTVMSGVMGMGLGVLFGVVMGTMDAGVSLYTSVFDP